MNGYANRASRLALFAAMLLTPSLAVAQCPPDADALLFEVSETMVIRAGGVLRRDATATLVGTVREGTPICPPSIAIAGHCTLSVTASDFIRLDTGEGPVYGKFSVLGPGETPDDVDGFEQILIEGTLRGTIDLAPALVGKMPFAYLINASLQGRGVKNTINTHIAGERFLAELEGTFRLPFLIGDRAYYDCPGGVQPVMPNEESLGTATVRLEITFK